MKKLGKIFSWIFGIIFFLAALGAAVDHTYWISITYAAMAAALLPPARSMAHAATKITLSGKQKVALVFMLFVLNLGAYFYESPIFKAAMQETDSGSTSKPK